MSDIHRAMVDFMDRDPGRACPWCFHPRNSAECDFGAKHVYIEQFAWPHKAK